MEKQGTKYSIIKDNKYNDVVKILLTDGFYMPIKNKKIMIKDINVQDNELVTNILNKKIEKKFITLLELIAKIYESDDDPIGGLMVALTETERFKREIINKYNSYLKKSQKELVDKKIRVIEKEIKNKLYSYQRLYEKSVVVDNEEEKETHHSR